MLLTRLQTVLCETCEVLGMQPCRDYHDLIQTCESDYDIGSFRTVAMEGES